MIHAHWTFCMLIIIITKVSQIKYMFNFNNYIKFALHLISKYKV